MSWPEPGYETPPPVVQYNTPPALIAFTLAILVLCFVAFSIVYLCKFCLVSVIQSWAFERSASGSLAGLSQNNRSPSTGLDPSLLHMFPTFVHSSMKNLRQKNTYSFECAICLLEFEDDSVLRLLPVCCHVFHQECLDLWLCSHKTCPVCRTDLQYSPSTETPKYGGDSCNHDDHAEGEYCESGGDIRIDIREGEGGDIGGDGDGDGESATHDHIHDHDQAGANKQQQQEHTFTRSNSTGHSIVMIRGEEGADEDKKEDDKYSSRLPEHVLRSRGGRHNYSKSCTSYQEMQMTRPACSSNCGFVKSTISAACSNSLPHAQKT